MATRNRTTERTVSHTAFVATWSGLLQGDNGDTLDCTRYVEKSVQVSGTFGGATLQIQGSNDGSTWAVLTDAQGNDLAITTAKIEMVSEATRFIRPLVSGGDGTTSLVVSLLLKE